MLDMPVAVVLILSKEFVSKKYPMEELQLLMAWQKEGSPARLLPVLYHITFEELNEKVEEYKAALLSGGGVEGDEQCRLEQWVQDLTDLQRHTAFRKDQVPLPTMLCVCCLSFFMPSSNQAESFMVDKDGRS
jgi:hypothetical protein